MINEALAPIDELVRLPSPCPEPQALACDGTDLWVGSVETARLYGLRSATGAVFEEAAAPGEPIGMVLTGDAMRVVCSEQDDSRFIRRYVIGHGFKSEAIACADDTGSFLAWDGDHLFLSQRSLHRILKLSPTGDVLATYDVGRQITGMCFIEGRFFLITTDSRESDDYRLVRFDARNEGNALVELASIPFRGRSLAWDGTRFWTNHRSQNTIVAFSAVGV
jgi:hypothetical protein